MGVPVLQQHVVIYINVQIMCRVLTKGQPGLSDLQVDSEVRLEAQLL